MVRIYFHGCISIQSIYTHISTIIIYYQGHGQDIFSWAHIYLIYYTHISTIIIYYQSHCQDMGSQMDKTIRMSCKICVYIYLSI